MKDDFQAHLQRLREEREEAKAQLRHAWEESPAVLMSSSGVSRLLLLTPSTVEDVPPLRVSELDPDGPVSHQFFETTEDAVEEYASSRYSFEPVDEQFVIDWTSTPQWEEGLEKVAYVQARNQVLALIGAQPEAERERYYEEMNRARRAPTVHLGRMELEKLKRKLSA